MKKYISKLIWCGLILAITQGCSIFASQEEQFPVSQNVRTVQPLGNIEYHTSELATELFANIADFKQYRYAVAGFVPVDSMKYAANAQHPLMLLGHQLEQGMMTEASRRGFITQDYKVTNDIVIESQSERVFSRNLQELGQYINVDFYISGTITEQQEGAIVNARVIHVQTHDVVAAATKFFPAQLFWGKEKVTTRNGLLYRSGE